MSKILVSLLLTLQVISFSDALLQTRSFQLRFKTALNSVGSDLLQRPEDEDSVEYREYLKNLMKMQANRARAGHAAPSSGSSDAYFAKLSRLKVERQALRKAGLPEDMLNTGYTQDDYDSAIYEAQEPLVSGAVLTGDAAVATRDRKSNSKVRGMTFEEKSMEEAANALVAAELKRQESLPPSERVSAQKKSVAFAPTGSISDEVTPETNLIDDVLAGRSLISLIKPKQMNSYMDNQRMLQDQIDEEEAEAARNSAPTPASAPAPVVSKPPPVQKAVVVEKVAPVATAVPLRPLPPRQAPPAPPASPVVKSVAAPVAAAVSAPAATGKKLKSDDLELMAKSLQMLVKHRGGGPFGPGRLQTEKDIMDMEMSLIRTVELLGKTDGVAVAAPRSAAPVPVPAPVRAAPAPVARVVQPTPVAAPVAAPVAVVAPVEIKVVAPVAAQMESEEAPPMTIAQGLDQFLSAPQLRSTQELAGLRDGLIQVLYMVQTELQGRPVEDDVIEASSTLNDAQALERIMRINAPDMATPVERDNAVDSKEVPKEIPIEQDVKLALGLLLKHRGGPGFGHGRLVGKELDLMASKLRYVIKNCSHVHQIQIIGSFQIVTLNDTTPLSDRPIPISVELRFPIRFLGLGCVKYE